MNKLDKTIIEEKKLNKIAIKVLIDAEKVFREEPEAIKDTNRGLCRFIYFNKFVTEYRREKRRVIMSYILQDKYADHYTFGIQHGGRNQVFLWKYEEEKYLRADWCKEQLLERFGIEV